MERIYTSPFYTIDWIASDTMFEFHFIDTTNMSWKDFQEELLLQVKFAHKYQPKYFFFDTQNFDFTIAPDMQDWIDTNIFAEFVKAGVVKYAYIVSKELISQLSIELLMDENVGKYFKTEYFTSEEEAKKWLFS